MMPVNAQSTVREIAVAAPATVRIFESFGIDYCCGGGKSLQAACLAANVPLEDVLGQLTSRAQAEDREDSGGWAGASLSDLTNHIVETHHAFVRRETPRLQELLEKTADRHAEDHPELRSIQGFFNTMAEELRMHMLKEERVLFPHIQQLEAAAAKGGPPAPASPFGRVVNPIAMMMAEHDHAADSLRQMRSASSNYALPDGACPTYYALYFVLFEFERDLHAHVHLENNILFPRAVELERLIGEHDGGQ